MDGLTRKQRKKWLDDSRRVLEVLKNVKPEEVPELALKNEELFNEFDYDYGQYLIHDGKIYRDVSMQCEDC